MGYLAKIAILLTTGLFAVANTQPGTVTFPNRHRGEVKGAAYFMNNDLTANYLFAADIGADAKLTLRKAYHTGGKGGHATGTINNALFSQGSVAATYHREGHLNVVVLVNAGSNTVTVFKINPNRPSELKILGRPVYSGGDFPVSVAINNAGNMVCALNGGTINGVSCFRLDSRKGLIPLPNATRLLNLPQSLIPNGPTTTVSEVTFTEDGKKLVVAVKGSSENPQNEPGYIVVWDVYEDKSLSAEFKRMIGGAWVWALTQIPGRNAFISGDVVTGAEIYDLDALARNSSAQSRNVQIPGHIAVCWSGYSKVTGNFYLVDFEVPSLDEIHVDADLNGSVVAIHQLDQYDGASDLSINHINGKDRLYLLASNTTSVEVFTIQGPGELERIQKVNISALAEVVGLRFEAKYNYGIATFVA
ncbi:hypothetical protein AX15_002868 [Amanita polypyramis BW_CC]|nr:hypothetical protein AX15_002868 [Amanita polypyramis BW_CC]